MPEQNTVSAELRPLGVKWRGRCTPGHMWVCRRMNGTYRIQLTVAQEEQDRREAEVQAREQAAEQAAEEVLKQLPAYAREYCETIIKCSGRYGAEQYFRNPKWLAEREISPAVAAKVLHGLAVFDQAETARRIELRLAPAAMADAKALLDRVSRA